MSPADKNIAIFSEQKNLPRFFSKGRKIFRFYFIKCWNVWLQCVSIVAVLRADVSEAADLCPVTVHGCRGGHDQ